MVHTNVSIFGNDGQISALWWPKMAEIDSFCGIYTG